MIEFFEVPGFARLYQSDIWNNENCVLIQATKSAIFEIDGTKRQTVKGFNKVVTNYQQAIAGIEDNMTIMVGGFGLCGIPEGLIKAVYEKNIRGLTCISNNAGIDGFALGLWLEKRQIKTIIASYVGENELFEQLSITGEMEVILTPQGTLAEKIRAGGAGIPAFYTATGYGTEVAKNKETRQFGNRGYLLEHALTADFALIKAWKGDTMENLVYRKTTRNFNPMMATAAKTTVVEVEEIVNPGELDPDHIHTPGIYVHRIIKGNFEKRIERLTTQEDK